MPELDKLGLTEESVPQVDWDAPEPGKVPPPVTPGRYWLLFQMPEDKDSWFDAVEREVVTGDPKTKRKFLEVTFEPVVIANSQKQPISYPDGSPLKLGPQRANTFMSAKMRIHQLGELLRSCGVRLEGSITSQIEGVLNQMNGQAQFEAEIIWRTYFKSSETTISSSPRKGKGRRADELPWPKDAQGGFELLATNPTTGEKAYGYAEIARYHVPTLTGEGA